MTNYYIYRINVNYDGFYPNRINSRLQYGKFVYNWRAYIDNLEEGDIVLAYFLGPQCRDGIFAVTQVESINPKEEKGNVIADLIFNSNSNYEPIIDRTKNKDIFKKIMCRPRGSEVLIWAEHERKIIELLHNCNGLRSQLTKLNLTLPGFILPSSFLFDEIPIIDPTNDTSIDIRKINLISCFWIRPRQASWLKTLQWLSTVSSLFYRFKSGDSSFIHSFSGILSKQIMKKQRTDKIEYQYLIGAPLSETKRIYGEIDRVDHLCKELAKKLNIYYIKLLRLEGNVTRKTYKRLGYVEKKFINDYTLNLKISRKGMKIINQNPGKILLVDDVYTDGVTTSTIINYLQKKLTVDTDDIHVATLGIMVKVNNISSKLNNRWHA